MSVQEYPIGSQPQMLQQPGQGLYCQMCKQTVQPEYTVVTQYSSNQNLTGLLCWPCVCCMSPAEAVQVRLCPNCKVPM